VDRETEVANKVKYFVLLVAGEGRRLWRYNKKKSFCVECICIHASVGWLATPGNQPM